MPPLNAAIGVESASGVTSISIPRGGRPLVTANAILASRSRLTARDGGVGQPLVRRDECSVDIAEDEADSGRAHGAIIAANDRSRADQRRSLWASATPTNAITR